MVVPARPTAQAVAAATLRVLPCPFVRNLHTRAGAREALQRLRSHGVLLGIVSNFDTRLRPILRDLGAEDLFDAVVVSAEVGGHHRRARHIAKGYWVHLCACNQVHCVVDERTVPLTPAVVQDLGT